MAQLVRSPEETHAELARTVGELGRWLSVMDSQLGVLLAASNKGGGAADVIEETAEPEEEHYGSGREEETVHARNGSVPFALAVS